MRTAIDSTPNRETTVTTTTGPLNDIQRPQNRIRHQNKKLIDGLPQTVLKHTNDENIDNNIVNNETIRPINRPSIGKWMYETDDYIPEEVAIDLSANRYQPKSDKHLNNRSDDDVIFIEDFIAGPSGLNTVHKNNTEAKDNINSNDLTLDCDLIPNIDIFNVLEEVVFDSTSESIEDLGKPSKEVRASTETITIDDEEEEEVIACDVQPKRKTTSEEVEIIRVKFLNEPNDPDIELVSQILSPSEVIDVMRSHLKSVQSLTGLSFTTIRLFMSKYQWIKDQFVNDFFEYGIERLLSAHKLVLSFQMKATGSKRRKRNHCPTTADPLASDCDTQSQPSSEVTFPQELRTCIVCYDESNASDMFGPNCGHTLCIDCWNQYISQHVSDRSSQEMISCPGEDCPNIVDDEDLLAIIREASVRDRYQRLMSNSFVSKNPLLKWCPNGDCLHAVRVKEGGFQDVECVCKTVFCYLCGDRWHEPLSCQQHQNWIQKYASATVDSQSANWLTQHTKCCPKCQFPIEKNGGCNYILCQRCRHQFCYECLGRCSHGRCLKQNAADALSAQSADKKLKEIELRIYPTIKDQYQQQSKQFAIEDKLQKDVSLKLEKAVKCPEFRSALKFIKSAFTVLCHCRQTLMYSYVFGYYLLGPESQIGVYTFHLKELERQTSLLSRMLTTETAVIQREAVYEIKRVVQPIYKACEAKRSALVQCIKQGLTQNVWQFSSLSP